MDKFRSGVALCSTSHLNVEMSMDHSDEVIPNFRNVRESPAQTLNAELSSNGCARVPGHIPPR